MLALLGILLLFRRISSILFLLHHAALLHHLPVRLRHLAVPFPAPISAVTSESKARRKASIGRMSAWWNSSPGLHPVKTLVLAARVSRWRGSLPLSASRGSHHLVVDKILRTAVWSLPVVATSSSCRPILTLALVTLVAVEGWPSHVGRAALPSPLVELVP